MNAESGWVSEVNVLLSPRDTQEAELAKNMKRQPVNEARESRGRPPASSPPPRKDACFKCGGSGHFRRECRQSATNAQPHRGQKRGQLGHASHDGERAERPQRACYICGQVGHLKRGCAQQSTKAARKRARAEGKRQDDKYRFRDGSRSSSATAVRSGKSVQKRLISSYNCVL